MKSVPVLESLMSLYFESEEDTTKNEIPATIFLRFF